MREKGGGGRQTKKVEKERMVKEGEKEMREYSWEEKKMGECKRGIDGKRDVKIKKRGGRDR